VKNREALEQRLERVQLRYPHGDVTRPETWGGYRLVPDTFEFWQGRDNRLHDRFQYRLQYETWEIQRLMP
jgi:pyridoxamine 5'-phosphate oxidase